MPCVQDFFLRMDRFRCLAIAHVDHEMVAVEVPFLGLHGTREADLPWEVIQRPGAFLSLKRLPPLQVLDQKLAELRMGAKKQSERELGMEVEKHLMKMD